MDAEKSILENLFGHNHWATQVVLRHCRRFTAEQFQQRFEIGPGSLHDTLTHIIGAMRRWADRIGERPLRERLETAGPYSPAELLTLLDDAHADLFAVVTEVVEGGRLQTQIEFPSQEGGAPLRFTRAAAIVHVATHGMHHRAQTLNMLRRLGQPITGLDLDTVEWECVRTGQLRDPYAE